MFGGKGETKLYLCVCVKIRIVVKIACPDLVQFGHMNYHMVILNRVTLMIILKMNHSTGKTVLKY